MTNTIRDELAAALRNLSKRCQEELADPEDVGELMRAYVVLAKHDAATPSSASVRDSVCDASAGAGEGWRPIETAPKETELLVGKWVNDEWRICQSGFHWFPGNGMENEPGYWAWHCDWDHGGVTDDEGPSHWMPLPAAPSQPHGKEGK